MTAYYRIIEKKWAGSPLGYGARGARWNPPGVPMVYAGSSVAIITLEFISVKGASVVTSEWSLVTLQIVNEPPRLEVTSLPPDWDSRPYSLSTQEFGREWARTHNSVCLKVLSARIPISSYPGEHNLLINPLHPDFSNEVLSISIHDMFFNLNEWATGVS